jgi:hypothetical protein
LLVGFEDKWRCTVGTAGSLGAFDFVVWLAAALGCAGAASAWAPCWVVTWPW